MSGAKSRFIVDRRSVLGGAAAATALGALPTRLAWGQGAKTLRAGITGSSPRLDKGAVKRGS